MATTSSLLRSASAAQKRVQAQRDAEVAYNWNNSYQTIDNYREYAAYLDKRAKGISDPSAALTLQKAKDSAYKGYVGNEIQRKTSAVLQGRSTSVDKFNTILNFMQEAQDIGQYALAQNLNSQLDTLSVSIQNEAQRAQDSAQRLGEMQQAYAEKQAKAGAAANLSMGKTLEAGLGELQNAFAKGGQTAYNAAAKKFVDQNKTMIESLTGKKLPKDISTNIGQVVEGTIQGIATYYKMAGEAIAMTDPEKAVEYQDKALGIINGNVKYKTPAGNMSLYDAREFAQNPTLYGQTQDKNTGQFGLTKRALAGYAVDEQGNVIKQATTNFTSGVSKNDKGVKAEMKRLEKLGFGAVNYDEATGQYSAQLSNKTNEWFKATDIGLPENSQINLIKTATGFQYVDATGKNLYNLAVDDKGLGGIYKVDNLNKQTHLSGQYGFNQSANSLIKRADFLQTAKQLEVFNKAAENARLAEQSSQAMAQRLANAGQKSVGQYLQQQGVKNYGPDRALAPAQQAYVNKIYLQPWNQQKGQIGGKYYNYAGNYIPGMAQRNGGGFNFTDANGKPISALTYAQQTKSDFGQLLSYLGSKGDSYAAQYAKNPGAAGSSLTWR